MKIAYSILDDVIDQLQSYLIGRNQLDETNQKAFYDFLDSLPFMIWLDDLPHIKPKYLNVRARAYFGISKKQISRFEFEIYKKVMHPNEVSAIKHFVNFFSKKPHGKYTTTILVKHAEGTYRYIYKVATTLTIKNGRPDLILHIFFDIDGLLAQPFKKSDFHIDHKQVNQNNDLFYTLSKREKEIALLVAEHLTSVEIGEILGIKTATVKLHRKKIHKKLNIHKSTELTLLIKSLHNKV